MPSTGTRETEKRAQRELQTSKPLQECYIQTSSNTQFGKNYKPVSHLVDFLFSLIRDAEKDRMEYYEDGDANIDRTVYIFRAD